MASKSNPVSGLSRFEGTDVLAATIKVTNAGDGLSAALSVDPQEFALHDRVYLVLETEVARVAYEDMPKMEGARQRVHTLKTLSAAIADGQVVSELLADTKRLLAIRAEEADEAKGILKLEGTKVADGEPSE